MKKRFLALVFVGLIISGFAQEESKKEWEQVVVTSETGKIPGSESQYALTISYTPFVNEALFVYQTSSAAYNEKDAVLTIRERILLFNSENNYDSYSYVVKPLTKYDNVNKIATLTCIISLNRYTVEADY
ncbi:MAG: hypothetical protein ACRC4W_03215 [Treponemataceae bacterium]